MDVDKLTHTYPPPKSQIVIKHVGVYFCYDLLEGKDIATQK